MNVQLYLFKKYFGDWNDELEQDLQKEKEEFVKKHGGTVDDYVEKQRSGISNIVEYSAVLGFDYYHFTKDLVCFYESNNITPLIETDFASSEKLDSVYSFFRNEKYCLPT